MHGEGGGFKEEWNQAGRREALEDVKGCMGGI